MTQAKKDTRPVRAPKGKPAPQHKVRRQRKPHPTDGWFNLGQRAHTKGL